MYSVGAAACCCILRKGKSEAKGQRKSAYIQSTICRHSILNTDVFTKDRLKRIRSKLGTSLHILKIKIHLQIQVKEDTLHHYPVHYFTTVCFGKHKDKVQSAQCGNFKIFLSFRFYVKSILENLEVVKVPFFAILGALNFVDLVNFSLQKAKKIYDF